MSRYLTIKHFIQDRIHHLEQQPALRFILIMTGYNLVADIVSVPFYLTSTSLGIERQLPSLDPLVLFISYNVTAPILETFLGQMVPILVARRFIRSSWIILLISATLFAIPHSTLDIFRLIPSFLGGILLAFTFLHWLKFSVGKAYWITCAVHFLHNVIVTSPLLFINGSNA